MHLAPGRIVDYHGPGVGWINIAAVFGLQKKGRYQERGTRSGSLVSRMSLMPGARPRALQRGRPQRQNHGDLLPN
eukprot:5388578-Pyramimonas_sp.AAC.1